MERDFIARIKIYSVTISTHTLTWSVTHKHVAFVTNCSISTHTLTWSVTNSVLDTVGLDTISTHTLTWSVTFTFSMSSANFNYFNSHAHVERDDYVKFHIAIFFISTHTLTWSVTANIYAKRGRRYISTHTLTWSVTLSPRPVQSTSLIISTHTLTWSVTDAAPE